MSDTLILPTRASLGLALRAAMAVRANPAELGNIHLISMTRLNHSTQAAIAEQQQE